MNYFNEKYKSFYHIYFNDNPKELKRNYIRKDDNVEKIKIIYFILFLFSIIIIYRQNRIMKVSKPT